MRLPGVPEPLRGTYAAMGHPATTDSPAAPRRHRGRAAADPRLHLRGAPRPARPAQPLGATTPSAFAPHGAYAHARDPQGAPRRGQVDGPGAAPGGDRGHPRRRLQPHLRAVRRRGTLSLRGLDNRAYYRLDARGVDIDVTGCGNTVDLRHAVVCRMVLDSLRYWVEQVHVDGFRFDLAGRPGSGGRNPRLRPGPFLVALRTGPGAHPGEVSSPSRGMSASAGGAPATSPPVVEWNDRFRDTAPVLAAVTSPATRPTSPGMASATLGTRLAGWPTCSERGTAARRRR